MPVTDRCNLRIRMLQNHSFQQSAAPGAQSYNAQLYFFHDFPPTICPYKAEDPCRVLHNSRDLHKGPSSGSCFLTKDYL